MERTWTLLRSRSPLSLVMAQRTGSSSRHFATHALFPSGPDSALCVHVPLRDAVLGMPFFAPPRPRPLRLLSRTGRLTEEQKQGYQAACASAWIHCMELAHALETQALCEGYPAIVSSATGAASAWMPLDGLRAWLVAHTPAQHHGLIHAHVWPRIGIESDESESEYDTYPKMRQSQSQPLEQQHCPNTDVLDPRLDMMGAYTLTDLFV
jgi:hypothetical protein